MKKAEYEKRICPICGITYTERPALSRIDDETPVCPDCGIRQSLESIGISEAEQAEILEIIHRNANQNS